MVWDSTKVSKETIRSSDWNNMVTDQKTRSVIHRKVFDLSTENSVGSAGGTIDVPSGSFTLNAPTNSLILGIYITVEMKADINNRQQYAYLKVNGTNLGTRYLIASSSDDVSSFDNQRWSSSEAFLFNYSSATYGTLALAPSIPLKILDNSTNFTFRISSASGVCYIKNIHCEVIYSNIFTED